MARTGALQSLLDLSAVTEAHRRAGRIDHKLSCQITGDLLFIVQQQLFQFADVRKLPSVRQFGTGVYWERQVEGEFLPILSQTLRRHAVAHGSITVAPATHHVKVFECESCRINLRVAGRAGLLSAMFI